MSKKMSSKHATLYYCLLLVLLLHADHTSATLAANCIYTSPAMPFCKGWMCKTECWTEAKLIGATVTGRQCMKGGFHGWCSCYLCKN
ncbi:hypothetical protein SETIT_7G020800v2 [Setaria italica]|uniref:Knottin scorpion toxin-like domain-containing protein n=1 Tax=Setaria italica TaxID=4555 RepID=A0A368RR63_SETIT|nr:hypothetical protein SETIT_7G020800v2 [Setaria italica]